MRPMESVLVVEFSSPPKNPAALIAKIAPDATVKEIRSDGCVTVFLLESPSTHQVSKTVGQLEYEDGVVGGYLAMVGDRLNIHPKS